MFIHSYKYEVTKSQIQYFMFGWILLYIVKGTPYAIISNDYLFSAHVFQLSAIFFIVTPLLVLSLPSVFMHHYFWNYKMKFLITVFGHPWLTAIAFNGLFTAYLSPPIFNMLKENIVFMALAQIILMINALLMWWVIISPVPLVSNIAYLTRIAYIFFTSLLLMPIGIFLLVIQDAHYPFYEAVSGELIPMMTAVYDQQLAGGLLKITQLASYAYALLFIVMAWGRMEQAKEGTVDDENIRVARGVVIHLNPKGRKK